MQSKWYCKKCKKSFSGGVGYNCPYCSGVLKKVNSGRKNIEYNTVTCNKDYYYENGVFVIPYLTYLHYIMPHFVEFGIGR